MRFEWKITAEQDDTQEDFERERILRRLLDPNSGHLLDVVCDIVETHRVYAVNHIEADDDDLTDEEWAAAILVQLGRSIDVERMPDWSRYLRDIGALVLAAALADRRNEDERMLSLDGVRGDD